MPEKTMGRWLGCVISVLAATLAWLPAAQAQDKEALKKLAMELPLADVHMHLYPGLTPQEVLAQMDRNNVRWGGGVGPVRPGVDAQEFSKLLGKRYFPAGAQPDYMAIYTAGGTAEMADPNSGSFKALHARLKQDFEDKKIHGLGELILNNRGSHPTPAFRRKVAIDAPTFIALFQLAEQYEGFVQIHMEDDRDSIEQLQKLLTAHPRVPVILSHCMALASASAARAVLEKHPNVHCDTSSRNPVFYFHPTMHQHQIHNDNWTQPSWLALIEAMPDRFLVGSDATGAHFSYDAIIKTIRGGLLANLSESTMRKVAHGNAERLFRLQAP